MRLTWVYWIDNRISLFGRWYCKHRPAKGYVHVPCVVLAAGRVEVKMLGPGRLGTEQQQNERRDQPGCHAGTTDWYATAG